MMAASFRASIQISLLVSLLTANLSIAEKTCNRNGNGCTAGVRLLQRLGWFKYIDCRLDDMQWVGVAKGKEEKAILLRSGELPNVHSAWPSWGQPYCNLKIKPVAPCHSVVLSKNTINFPPCASSCVTLACLEWEMECHSVLWGNPHVSRWWWFLAFLTTGTRSMEGKAVPVGELHVETTTPATILWCQAQLANWNVSWWKLPFGHLTLCCQLCQESLPWMFASMSAWSTPIALVGDPAMQRAAQVHNALRLHASC